tara:strand:- start:5518 stop:8202 length:2685 start_codon:yes stop_codon:yes gene_type:complete
MKVKPAPFNSRKLLRSQDGQLTVFLAIGLTIFITMTAFIINIGLFVKAKINLQNATDAAAWSGAAVQARQLSQIAYLNYEIRNVYKEWMFKYYVLGNLGHSRRMGTPPFGLGDYRLRPAGGLSTATNFDRYNIPSICVHAGTGTNDICLSSFIPGLPRFETIDLPNITSESQQFIDKISSKKADDCSYRSSINFATALIWTYGTGANITTSDLPALTNGRLGAWPAAFLLGARVRTLEAMVNRPPVEEICLGNCATPLGNLDVNFVANERPIKAFMAGYRNYSGGTFKQVDGGDGGMDETSATFVIEELSPQPVTVSPASLGGMMIPTENPPWNENLLEKRYLDLHAIPVNYAIFYTSFSSRTNDLNIDGTNISTDAECTTTKTALPVPAYLTGFQKNPEVITYYAVRSRVKFSGLFFPFGQGNELELSTVSAAKPFGGRIGPKLFQVVDENKISPRTSGTEQKSAPNLAGLIPGTTGILDPGTPIPVNQDFWIQDIGDVIGGVPGTGIDPKFSVPNMVYYFSSPNASNGEINFGGGGGGGTPFEQLSSYANINTAKRERFGLYNDVQFDKLRSNLPPGGAGGALTTNDLNNAIDNVRKPTYYDTQNYLIPTNEEIPDLNIKITAQAPGVGTNNIYIYAPLVDTNRGNSLYTNTDGLKNLVYTYIQNNNESVVNFLEALKQVAEQVKASAASSSSGNTTLYDKTANIIYPLDAGTAPNDAGGFQAEMATSSVCAGAAAKAPSIAARFSTFLQQDTATCANAKPLSVLVGDYLEEKATNDQNFMIHHYDTWYTGKPDHLAAPEDIMSAYMPGPAQGADDEGKIDNPLTGGAYNNFRNYYSTKFIPFELISPSGAPLTASLMEENDGSIFVINQDVRDQTAGGYKNKLQEDINVKW